MGDFKSVTLLTLSLRRDTSREGILQLQACACSPTSASVSRLRSRLYRSKQFQGCLVVSSWAGRVSPLAKFPHLRRQLYYVARPGESLVNPHGASRAQKTLATMRHARIDIGTIRREMPLMSLSFPIRSNPGTPCSCVHAGTSTRPPLKLVRLVGVFDHVARV